MYAVFSNAKKLVFVFYFLMLILTSSCTQFVEAWAKISGSESQSSVSGQNPVAANLTPPSFNEDVQTIITLSYTDAQNDKATSCSISALSNISVTQACTCDGSGVCTVGVTGVLDYNGAASFNYTVTHDGQTSNAASANLTINSVNDLATVTVPANLLYPLDGSNEPMIQGTQYVLNFSAIDNKDNQAITSLGCTIQSIGMHTSDANYLAAGTNCNTLESLTTTNSVLVKSTANLSTSPGMNATGSLTWTPTSFQRGTFQITITANDGVAPSSSSFFVTVREPFTNGSALVLALDASMSFDNTSTGAGVGAVPRLDGTAEDNLSDWLGLKGVINGILGASNFTVTNPWSGTGIYSNPYQLNFNGVNDVLNLGSVLSGATRTVFSMWVKPTSVNTANSILLSNGGGTGNGIVFRQSRTGSGQLEIEVGNIAQNYSAAVLADSPIAYWRLDDTTATIADTSGANNCGGSCNGTAAGSYTQSVTGALSKDTNTATVMGANGYVDFGSNFNFGNAGTDNPFSVEFWINRTTADTGWVNWRYIFSKTDTGVHEYVVRLNDTLINLALSSPDGANVISASGVHNIIPGSWYHIVVTYDGSKLASGINIFVNSVNTIKNTSNLGTYNGMTNTAATARIGKLAVLPYNLDGTTIDEVAIYNYALSANTVSTHYLAGAGCRSTTAMQNNEWYHLSGVKTLTNLQLFVNGAQECNFATAGVFSPAATNLFMGATSVKTFPFAGSIADLKIHTTSNGATPATATDINSDALAGMNRFRSKPLEDIVKTNILAHWDAAYAKMGSGPQVCGLDLANKNLLWFDISRNSYVAGIVAGSNYACGAGAWAGNGTAGDPHRFILNAGNDVRFESSSFINQGTTGTYEFWIKADKALGPTATYDGLIGTDNSGLNIYYFTDQVGKMDWYSGGAFTTVNAADGPTDTNWHQIVFVMNGASGLGYIYIDGTLMNPGGTAFTPTAIGAGTFGLARGQHGAYRLENPLAIARVYSVALTQNQIRQNCHAQKNRFAGMVCAGP